MDFWSHYYAIDKLENHYTSLVSMYSMDILLLTLPLQLALSNIFEYMSQEAADALFGQLAAQVPSSGRIAYWEFLNHRLPSSEALKQRLCTLEEVSTRLGQEDRFAFFVIRVLEVR